MHILHYLDGLVRCSDSGAADAVDRSLRGQYASTFFGYCAGYIQFICSTLVLFHRLQVVIRNRKLGAGLAGGYSKKLARIIISNVGIGRRAPLGLVLVCAFELDRYKFSSSIDNRQQLFH